MAGMFEGATAFNGNLSGWDVSEVLHMASMFEGATAFNGNLSGWDVSEVLHMASMFEGATAFNQNLGAWYIVPATADFDAGGASLDVTNISAQNHYLGGQNPAYGIGTGGNSGLFEMKGSTLAFRSAPNAGSYQANVTASGSAVFEDGNNWRCWT